MKLADKWYKCDQCGKVLHDWETYETGWPDDIHHWCLYPDHSPK